MSQRKEERKFKERRMASQRKTKQQKKDNKSMGTRNQDDEKMKSNRQQKKKLVDVAYCQGELCRPPLRVSLNQCNRPLNLKRAKGGEGVQVHLLRLYSFRWNIVHVAQGDEHTTPTMKSA